MRNRKKRTIRAVALVLLLALLGAWLPGCTITYHPDGKTETTASPGQSLPPFTEEWPAFTGERTTYTLSIDFAPDRYSFSAKQIVNYINTSQDDLDELVFHVYASAFATAVIAPFERDDIELAYPGGFSAGYCTFEQVTVNGTPISAETTGPTNSILRLPVAEGLSPGQSCEVTFQYVVTIPRCNGRFGYDDDAFNLANCYPIAAVYDDDGWHEDPYYAMGDPFFSGVADYRVDIRAPIAYTVASSGQLTFTPDGDTGLWTAEASNVRDFTWFASTNYSEKTSVAGDVNVTVYHYADDAMGTHAADISKQALTFFSDTFGAYPYGDFRVVESGFYIGGMEYPGIVQIGTELFRDESELTYVLAHEIAHQWFYQLVGNNEIEEPWVDESLAEYATWLFLEEIGEENDLYLFNERFGYEAVNLPVYEYPDSMVYSLSVYMDGLLLWKQLNNMMGDGALNAALRNYVETYRYRNATGGQLLAMLGEQEGAWLREEMSKAPNGAPSSAPPTYAA